MKTKEILYKTGLLSLLPKIIVLMETLMLAESYIFIIYNLREKFSPGPGIEPGSPALRTGAITTKPPRRSAGSS